MSRGSPPLRFLTLVIGGWACGRALFLAPAWLAEPVEAAGAPSVHQAAPLPRENGAQPESRSSGEQPREVSESAVEPLSTAPIRPEPTRRLVQAVVQRPSTPLQTNEGLELALMPPLASAAAPVHPPLLEKPRVKGPGRWSFSGWAYVRRGEVPSLVAGGSLGGSQVGGRLRYRLNDDAARPLALSTRFYMPAKRKEGAEAALGLDWRPSKRLPIHLLAERRQALGREGRSAFGLTAYGGLDDVALGRFRLSAYGQTGVVGTRSRDLFADGAVRLSLPTNEVGRLKIGLGAWAAAQPGVSRIDVGPQASVRLPTASGSITLFADWRFRAAGDARPGSGPSLTVATDF